MGGDCPIANFAKVDDKLWRGAAPGPEGAQWLVDKGVGTIINLEWEQVDQGVLPPPAIGRKQIVYLRLKDWEPIPWLAPSVSDKHVLKFLHYVRVNPKFVYCHCRSGQNRTGVMVAAYRLIEKDEPLDQVLADFESYRGLWAWPDARYIQTLASRRGEFLAQVNGM